MAPPSNHIAHQKNALDHNKEFRGEQDVQRKDEFLCNMVFWVDFYYLERWEFF